MFVRQILYSYFCLIVILHLSLKNKVICILLKSFEAIIKIFLSGLLKYQAQSPDENALVSAARNFGFVFTVCYYLVYNKSHDMIKDMLTS